MKQQRIFSRLTSWFKKKERKEKSLELSFLGFFICRGRVGASASGKEPACQRRRSKTHEFNPWVGKIPGTRVWQPTPVFLPGESHGQGSLRGYSPWDHIV